MRPARQTCFSIGAPVAKRTPLGLAALDPIGRVTASLAAILPRAATPAYPHLWPALGRGVIRHFTLPPPARALRLT
jgi:hypothetical protein